MAYWLVYTDPEQRSWNDLRDAGADGLDWDGVRDDASFDCLTQMRVGDLAVICHAGEEKVLQGVARVVAAPHADKSDDSGQWLSVKLYAFIRLINPVSARQCANDARLADMMLVKGGAQPVQPVAEQHWRAICELAGMPRMVESG